MATLGDTFRVYIKPSLNGLMVIRKRNTMQTSARVKTSQDRVRRAPPARPAHDAHMALSNFINLIMRSGIAAAGVCPPKRVYRVLSKVYNFVLTIIDALVQRAGVGYAEQPVMSLRRLQQLFSQIGTLIKKLRLCSQQCPISRMKTELRARVLGYLKTVLMILRLLNYLKAPRKNESSAWCSLNPHHGLGCGNLPGALHIATPQMEG